MNLLYGEIIEVSSENGLPVGRMRVHGATQKIPLGLLTDAVQGDRLLVCDGVAISKVAAPNERKTEHVFGDSR